MKLRLGWRPATRDEFAEHLRQANILAAEAHGNTSIYRCRNGDGETIAISLPGDETGGGLIVEIHRERPAALERRRPGGSPSGE